jgi:hypothetical protein
LDVQPVGILAADHPDEGAFAGEPLGPVPGGGIGQVEGAPVGVAAASTARRERAGQSDKRFRMPRSPGRVPPRCTARVPRNSARLEHLTRFDRRREAEQGDRLPPRSPDGRPLAGRCRWSAARRSPPRTGRRAGSVHRWATGAAVRWLDEAPTVTVRHAHLVLPWCASAAAPGRALPARGRMRHDR